MHPPGPHLPARRLASLLDWNHRTQTLMPGHQSDLQAPFPAPSTHEKEGIRYRVKQSRTGRQQRRPFRRSVVRMNTCTFYIYLPIDWPHLVRRNRLDIHGVVQPCPVRLRHTRKKEDEVASSWVQQKGNHDVRSEEASLE